LIYKKTRNGGLNVKWTTMTQYWTTEEYNKGLGQMNDTNIQDN